MTAKAVSVGVDLMPLIFSRSLHVKSFRLEDPQVVLLNSSSGQWNFSGLGGTSSSASSGGSTAAMSIVIQKVEIANGRILVGTPGVRGKERVYENVNLEVSDLSLTSQFPFRVTAKTPGGGTVTLDGKAGPFSVTDAAETPFQATAEVSHLDVASTGFVDPASGLAGVIDFKGTLASDAGRLTSKGTVNATGFQLVPGGTPARVPVEDRLRVRLQPQGADRRGQAGRRAHRQGGGASDGRLQRRRRSHRGSAETHGRQDAGAGS